MFTSAHPGGAFIIASDFMLDDSKPDWDCASMVNVQMVQDVPPASPPKPHLFTTESARVLGVKSGEVRRARREAASTMPQSVSKPPAFIFQRVLRLRTIIRALDWRLRDAVAATPLDGKLVEQLSRALSALSEQERILADRPLPPARRVVERSARGMVPARSWEVQPLSITAASELPQEQASGFEDPLPESP